MKIEISPEPEPGEREALEQALAKASGRFAAASGTRGHFGQAPRPERSEWWRRGVLEKALDEDPRDESE